MLTDNISAKTWTVFLTGYVIVEVQRIPGASTQMQPIDDLSRNRIPTGYEDPTLRVEINNEFLDQVFALCGLDLDEEFLPSCTQQLEMMRKRVTLVRGYIADTN
jgi:uncharacterized protein (DUF608 family)